MDRIKAYMFPLLALALLVALVDSFRTFFVTNIIQPIALMCWAIWRIIISVDQSVYWIVLIVVCSIPVLRLIPRDNAHRPKAAYDYKYQTRNRVEYWKTLITDATLGKEDAENLRESLKKLLGSVIPHIEGADPTDLEEATEIEKVPLSPRARRFLLSSNESKYLSIISVSPRWLRKWVAKFTARDSTALNEILEWMETEMEISHDK
jgi:hypothetical protein